MHGLLHLKPFFQVNITESSVIDQKGQRNFDFEAVYMYCFDNFFKSCLIRNVWGLVSSHEIQI